MKYLVYALVDPRTLLVRYVGKSSCGLKRPRYHKSSKRHSYCMNWVRSLQAAGFEYSIVVLEECTLETLSSSERWWIAYGRVCGWPLTNLTDGGEGAVGLVKTPEHRAKLGIAMAARMARPEIRERFMGDNSPTRRPEVRAKIGAHSKARWASPEARDKVHQCQMRWMSTPEAKAKYAGDNSPTKRPEVRAKISEGLRASHKRKRSTVGRLGGSDQLWTYEGAGHYLDEGGSWVSRYGEVITLVVGELYTVTLRCGDVQVEQTVGTSANTLLLAARSTAAKRRRRP